MAGDEKRQGGGGWLVGLLVGVANRLVKENDIHSLHTYTHIHNNVVCLYVFERTSSCVVHLCTYFAKRYSISS